MVYQTKQMKKHIADTYHSAIKPRNQSLATTEVQEISLATTGIPGISFMNFTKYELYFCLKRSTN